MTTLGVLKETFPGEKRVALIPSVVAHLRKAGFACLVETMAGQEAGFSDQAYQTEGAEIQFSKENLLKQADIILQVRGLGNDPEGFKQIKPFLRKNQTLIGLLNPLMALKEIQELAQTGISSLALEMIPRITKAQSMDVLSSMATIAGYKAVLLASDYLNKMLPFMITAAGTLKPARVFVIGAGVAGLQAIATARRLGALVKAFDIRQETKEEVESLGAQFVELPLETQTGQVSGGYAQIKDEAFYQKEQALLTETLAESDIVITTAAVPGKKAPLLINHTMLCAMTPHSVVVDLAAEQGGNCEDTIPGELTRVNDIILLGPINLATQIPYHASQLYANNLKNLLLYLFKNQTWQLNPQDELIAPMLITHQFQITQEALKI